jgi:hypothetical protein
VATLDIRRPVPFFRQAPSEPWKISVNSGACAIRQRPQVSSHRAGSCDVGLSGIAQSDHEGRTLRRIVSVHSHEERLLLR